MASEGEAPGGGDGERLAEEEETTPQALWEWCNDSFRWISYPPATSALIEAAFTSSRPSVDFDIARCSYSIVFEDQQPVQKNLTTWRKRPVKRQVSDGTSVSWLWWEIERQFWHTYDADLAQKIEQAWKESTLSKTNGRKKAPAGLAFVIRRQAYSIEFEKNGMQYNKATGFSRGVRRRLCSENAHLQNDDVAVSSSLGSASVNEQRESTLSSSDLSSTRVSVNDALQTILGPRLTFDESCISGGPSYDPNDVLDLTDPPKEADCSICLCSLQENAPVFLAKCKHLFHRDCIQSWFRNRPTCPECLMIYGTIVGTQPPGEMHVQYLTYRQEKCRLAGYPNTDVIKIVYNFPSGIQSAEHPNPGKPYFGTVRTAYLPKTRDGDEVLELLRKAWSRRLLFRIGSSVTTGQNNVITWAGIHHKTRMDGGSSRHGYPDETYFVRVKKELEEAGVV